MNTSTEASVLIGNPRAVFAPYPGELKQLMSIAQAKQSRDWMSGWSGLSDGPTPTWQLPDLAQRLKLGAVCVKDESKRSSLGSFKALGAPIALVRLIARGLPQVDPAQVLSGLYASELKDRVFISATDGNHGRALAAAARSAGARCVIVLHGQVSVEREQAIAALGATIVRIDGNYDASVDEAARLARVNGWQVVSDTSYEGYEDIPRDVMQGYGVIADELLVDQGASPFTHVIVQGGVGGLAAGIVSYFCERYGAARPRFIVAEPVQADCLMQSALQGRAARATGSVDSVMAGLACGEASPLAWRFLESAVDFFMTIADSQAIDAMHSLAHGSLRDIPIVSGESGAAGLAALQVLAGSTALRERTRLDSTSRVLLLNTEGATAPALYAELTGHTADDVLAAQMSWLHEHAASPHVPNLKPPGESR